MPTSNRGRREHGRPVSLRAKWPTMNADFAFLFALFATLLSRSSIITIRQFISSGTFSRCAIRLWRSLTPYSDWLSTSITVRYCLDKKPYH